MLDLKEVEKDFCYDCDKCLSKKINLDCLKDLLQLRQTLSLESMAGSLEKIANPMLMINGEGDIKQVSNMTKEEFEKTQEKFANDHHHALFGGSDGKD